MSVYERVYNSFFFLDGERCFVCNLFYMPAFGRRGVGMTSGM